MSSESNIDSPIDKTLIISPIQTQLRIINGIARNDGELTQTLISVLSQLENISKELEADYNKGLITKGQINTLVNELGLSIQSAIEAIEADTNQVLREICLHNHRQQLRQAVQARHYHEKLHPAVKLMAFILALPLIYLELAICALWLELEFVYHFLRDGSLGPMDQFYDKLQSRFLEIIDDTYTAIFTIFKSDIKQVRMAARIMKVGFFTRSLSSDIIQMLNAKSSNVLVAPTASATRSTT